MSGTTPINSLNRTQRVFSVDAFSEGIAFGQLEVPADTDPRDSLSLSLECPSGLPVLRSRYVLKKENPLWELECRLAKLSRQGILQASTIYFGVTSDPLHPFEGKFDVTMKFLQLFERFTPGRLIIQTRSPLIVLAMPVLKKLGDRVQVTMAIETDKEDEVVSLTPGLPRASERARACTALRRLGVPVVVQVGPVLPYGEEPDDANRFASFLNDHADYVYVQPLVAKGSSNGRGKGHVAEKLARQRRFRWLRPDSGEALIKALMKGSSAKLLRPDAPKAASKQLKIFAA